MTESTAAAIERTLLGKVLLDPAALREIPELSPEDFQDPRHRLVFQAMLEVEANSASSDPIVGGWSSLSAAQQYLDRRSEERQRAVVPRCATAVAAECRNPCGRHGDFRPA